MIIQDQKQKHVIGHVEHGNMNINEITKLKVLAGIIDKEGNRVDGDDESNISVTGSEKGRLQREKNIKPGTEEWFKLWFSKPHLTGEKPTGK